MDNMTVKVSGRYQIAVPSLARRLLKIKKGDRLLVDIQDGALVLLPEPENYTRRLAGLHSGTWDGKEAQKYIEEERQTWENSPKN